MVTKNSSNIATATSGTILRGQGIGVDSAFSTATYPATTVSQDMLYSSSTNTVTALTATLGRILSTDGSGVPSFGSSLNNDYTYTNNSSGGNRTIIVTNTDNTNTSSNSVILAKTGGASSGDPMFQASTTVTVWTWGIDNSVTSPTADPFVLSQGTSLGTNNVMSVATSGEINYPLQPAFLGTLGTQDSNATGDATQFTLGTGNALTEVFDQNADFNTNGTFTAPVTGKYHFSGSFAVSGSSAIGLQSCQIVTSNRTLIGSTNPTVATVLAIAGAFITTDMDLGDTATISGNVSGGTKTADVTTDSYFSGFLIA